MGRDCLAGDRRGSEDSEGLSQGDIIRYCYQNWPGSERVLLVFENAESAGVGLSDIKLPPESLSRFRVLILSQRHYGEAGWLETIVLDVLEPDDAAKLLLHLVGRGTHDAARELCAELGYLPLAVELTGRYIRDSERDLAAVRRQLHLDAAALQKRSDMTATHASLRAAVGC